MALLLAKKVTVLAKYSHFANVFSKESVNILSERNKVIEYAIKLEKGKQPPHGSIYSLGPIELETLKTYIKTNLVNNFNRTLKLSAGAPILFIFKTDGSFYLCVNYREFNNLTI